MCKSKTVYTVDLTLRTFCDLAALLQCSRCGSARHSGLSLCQCCPATLAYTNTSSSSSQSSRALFLPVTTLSSPHYQYCYHRLSQSIITHSLLFSWPTQWKQCLATNSTCLRCGMRWHCEFLPSEWLYVGSQKVYPLIILKIGPHLPKSSSNINFFETQCIRFIKLPINIKPKVNFNFRHL